VLANLHHMWRSTKLRSQWLCRWLRHEGRGPLSGQL
jgi:hypothetical protein